MSSIRSLSRVAPQPAASRARPIKICIRREDRYSVAIRSGLLDECGADLREKFGAVPAVVVTESQVRRLHGARLLNSLRSAGIDAECVVLKRGEAAKSLDTIGEICSRLVAARLDRRGLIINFGGGAVCDLGGLAASLYMRGIRYVNIATSLIAQVDASIGGKVAVNTSEAKNLLGAFHHPSWVACDPDLLRTLPNRDLRAGVAEAIKVAVIRDRRLFQILETRRDEVLARDVDALTEVVRRSAEAKAELLAIDPYESDLRRPLNLGHTLAHPIETEFGPARVRHGEAVGIGLAVACFIGMDRGDMAVADGARILGLLDAYDLLRPKIKIVPRRLVRRLATVRLIRGRALHFVVPTGITGVRICSDVGDAEVERALEEYLRSTRSAVRS